MTFNTLLKIAWSLLVVFTIYILSWLTFFDVFVNDKVSTPIVLITNILSIAILIIYTKELLFGYNPNSKNSNIKSLVVFSILIALLLIFQSYLFKRLLDENINDWEISLGLIPLLVSYLGIILNRVQNLKGV